MSDLDLDLNSKLINLFNNKKYSEIEFEIELLGDIEKQSTQIAIMYAAAKTLNKNSQKKDFEEASYLFEKSYVSNKSNLDCLYNLIIVSIKSGTFQRVLPHLMERYEKNNKDEKVLDGLSKINFVLGNVSEANIYSSQLIEVNPNYLNAWEDFLSSLNYTKIKSQEDYLKYALKFDNLPQARCKPFLRKQKKISKEKIRLGFVSSDFKKHSVSFFLKDTISKINKKDFRIFAFSNLDQAKHDGMTGSLKEIFDEWKDVDMLSNTELTTLIRSLDIDILIDLSGFTLGNRIEVFRARCAPIQISWLGYCNTLGIKEMDYLIADKNLIKKKEENLYSEKILYMPNIWSVMSKPEKLPNINELPSKKNTIFTFGSFNNFGKISDETIKVWSKILNNSNSRLILKSSSIKNEETNKNIIKKFKKYISEENKVFILDRSPTIEEHLGQYQKIDLALDTFPYPGVTTSFESILMGVPVLTMKGFNFNSRCGESINLNLQMHEFIADNENDYFQKAIKLQSSLNILEQIRGSLREKSLASPLFDGNNFAKEFSSILKKVIDNSK
tara:strand:+ start:64 stop:1734 length:1671 start_codon:yes stop_codon:yes gene_type:complete